MKIEVGSIVVVPRPNENDMYNHSFEGTVVDLKKDTDGSLVATVEDGDGDCFDIDLKRLKVSK